MKNLVGMTIKHAISEIEKTNDGTAMQLVVQFADRPVCPKCERIALWHKNKTCRCNHCGYEGPRGKQFKEYLRDGDWK